jgi:serine/threonine protein kinase
VNFILQACEGLSEAHAAGVVHRDIKPENLFLARRSDGKRTLKILDFGISKQTADDAPNGLTNSERSLGSPWYMSPEQMIDSSSVDHRADIWSLGVVLFELLTGSRPFEGTSIPEICAGVLTLPTPALRQRRPEIDPVLEAIVERCLAKNPDERPASVLALSADLEPFASSREVATETFHSETEKAFFNRPSDVDDHPPPSSGAPLTHRSSRRMTLARGLGVLGILATLALAIWAFAGTRNETDELQGPPGPALAQSTPGAALDEGKTPDPLPSAQAVTVVPLPAAEGQSPQPSGPPNGDSEPNETPSTTNETPHAAPRAAQVPGEARQPRAGAAPVLTQEEIRRRKEQYDRWLREQGLQRLDEVVVPSPSEAPHEPAR